MIVIRIAMTPSVNASRRVLFMPQRCYLLPTREYVQGSHLSRCAHEHVYKGYSLWREVAMAATRLYDYSGHRAGACDRVDKRDVQRRQCGYSEAAEFRRLGKSRDHLGKRAKT